MLFQYTSTGFIQLRFQHESEHITVVPKLREWYVKSQQTMVNVRKTLPFCHSHALLCAIFTAARSAISETPRHSDDVVAGGIGKSNHYEREPFQVSMSLVETRSPNRLKMVDATA